MQRGEQKEKLPRLCFSASTMTIVEARKQAFVLTIAFPESLYKATCMVLAKEDVLDVNAVSKAWLVHVAAS